MAETYAHTGNNKTLHALGGAALFILGILAFNASLFTSYSIVYILGLLLTFGGLAGFVLSFGINESGGILLGIISSILSFVLGILVMSNPNISLATLTLLLAMFFIVDGSIRVAAAFTVAQENAGWSLIYGIVLIVLGIAVWAHLPTISLYIFGAFIGIALMLKGVLIVATSTAPAPRTTTSHSHSHRPHTA